MAKDTWASGEGGCESDELNPRGWAQVDFSIPPNDTFPACSSSFQCRECLVGPKSDDFPLASGLQKLYQAKIEHRKHASWPRSSITPLCQSSPVAGLPYRISHLSCQFDTITATSKFIDLRNNGKNLLVSFSASLENVQDDGECEEWEGRLIWAAVLREDFLAYAQSWKSIGSQLVQYIPTPRYPSRRQAGHRAPFIDVGLGSSIGFFWALQLDWDTQFSAALVTSIAYWADMASGMDAPVGQLAEIFDVLPSLAQACTTGYHDNLSPMKALAIEYLRTSKIRTLPGSLPSVRDIWLSRLADVGARESCVLMTSCPSAFSDGRIGKDTRCLVAWAIIHDLFDLPRDLASGNQVNGVLWALFAGVSGHEVLGWLRDTILIASGRGSCAAKLLLCTAFVHVTNPRWAVNGLSLVNLPAWPKAPGSSASSGCKLPLFSVEDGSWSTKSSDPCKCIDTAQSNALGEAARDALRGTVVGFVDASQRLDAHNIGLSALLVQDWETLINLSRLAWGTFLSDLRAIATWVDRH